MTSDNKMRIPDVSTFDFGEPVGQDNVVRRTPIGVNHPSTPDFLRPQSQAPSKSAPLPRFEPGMLDALRSDPYTAPILDDLRDQAQKGFLAAVDQTLAALPKDAARSSTVILNSGPISGRRLMVDSRRGELADKSRRELVQAMAVETVFNLGNPDWDPTKPATSMETPNVLLALLR